MKKQSLEDIEVYAKSLAEGLLDDFDVDCSRNALLEEIENLWQVDHYAGRLFAKSFKVEIHVKELDGREESVSEVDIIAAVRRAGVTGAYTGGWHRRWQGDDEEEDTRLMYVATSSEIEPRIILEHKEDIATTMYADASAFYQAVHSLVASGKLKLST